MFARPAGTGPFPAVVAFGGSSGGLGPAASWAPVLASRGLATLAIALFGVPGLPDGCVGLEVEAVERAIGWLQARPDLAADRVGVMGQSRGSELALWSGALLDEVGAVVGIAASGLHWAGMGRGGQVDAPTYTFRGQPLPYLYTPEHPSPLPNGEPVALRPVFEHVLARHPSEELQAAEIPVERTGRAHPAGGRR